MNIIEAAKAIGQGKKVRRKNFPIGHYCYTSDKMGNESAEGYNKITDPTTSVPSNQFTVRELMADDWEIIEDSSPMDIAWGNLPPADERSSYGYFRMGWNAAQKHLNSKDTQ